MRDKRQKNQLVLAFTEKGKSEAPKASQEGTESFTAKCETEGPAAHEDGNPNSGEFFDPQSQKPFGERSEKKLKCRSE